MEREGGREEERKRERGERNGILLWNRYLEDVASRAFSALQ